MDKLGLVEVSLIDRARRFVEGSSPQKTVMIAVGSVQLDRAGECRRDGEAGVISGPRAAERGLIRRQQSAALLALSSWALPPAARSQVPSLTSGGCSAR